MLKVVPASEGGYFIMEDGKEKPMAWRESKVLADLFIEMFVNYGK